MGKQKVYFPNLNGLRFIAAFLVIIHHVEQFKSILKLENYWGKIPFIGIIGKLGVVLFFVLSGFLITYLLLTEEYSFKKISVKKFYMRRVIRIWPLYFLIILLAFIVLPNIQIFNLPGYGKDVIYSNLIWKLILYAIFFSKPCTFSFRCCAICFTHLVNWYRGTVLFGLAINSKIHKEISNIINVGDSYYLFGLQVLFAFIIW